VVCPTPAHQMVFPAYVRAVNAHTARGQRLAQAWHEPVHTWRLQPVVEALQAWRGVQRIIAVTRGAALGDLTRCDTPRHLMKDLGLIPSAYASGERRRQGAIPTAGNRHARRALVEGAWADRYPANVSRPWQRRRDQLPNPLQDLRWQAQVRLCTRVRRWMARGTHANQVVVAIARDLAGLLGAMAKPGPVAPSVPQTDRSSTHDVASLPRLSEEAQPRWGATLDGVTRPAGTRGPRVRQAPDGGTSGGRQPTDSSVINRRIVLAPPRPMTTVTRRKHR
jgi:transposase